jgi:hypothetical protein
MTGKMISLAMATRPCRRTLVVLTLWTCLCYLVFRATSRDDVVAQSGEHLSSRELLQKVFETRRPLVPTPSSSSSAAVNIFEMQPSVDRSPPKPEKDVVHDLASFLPNLPLEYIQENKDKKWHLKGNKTCAKFPTIYDLKISNTYWQVAETSNGTFYLYGAYLDRRKGNRLGPTIRILGMINKLEPTVKTFCQVWFEGSQEPVITKVLEYKYIWFKKWGNYKDGIFQPYMMACQLPSSHHQRVPVSVSVVENFCDQATNNLRVTYNVLQPGESKKPFAVCVKGLDFPTEDISVRLIEWIELLTQLGADKIFMYNLEAHPNVTKVLNYYVRTGQVDLTPLTLPGHQPNMHILQHLYLRSKLNNKRQNEVIPYNDCLYRNIYRYQYVALLDIDEVIMPLKRDNWVDMMRDVEEEALKTHNDSRASVNFRNAYFLDEMLDAHQPGGFFRDIPPYLHMMQHVYRSANYTKPGQYVKCFHDPEKVLILHNHFPLACLGGVCTSYPASTEMAHLQHYRADCVNTLKKSCARDYKNVSIIDTSIWRYKDAVVSRSTDALYKLGFFRTTGPSGAEASAADYNSVA